MARPPAGTSRRPCSPWSRTSSPLGAIRPGHRSMGAHHRTSSPRTRDPERGEGPTACTRVRRMAHGSARGLGHRLRTRHDRKPAEHRPGQRLLTPPSSRRARRTTGDDRTTMRTARSARSTPSATTPASPRCWSSTHLRCRRGAEQSLSQILTAPPVQTSTRVRRCSCLAKRVKRSSPPSRPAFGSLSPCSWAA